MFGPKRTLKSLMRELETGLRNGTIVLDSTVAAERKDLTEREKDVINNTTGYSVSPAEVEEVLCAFPTVAEAAVISVPDTERGEIVKALLVPRQGARIDVSAVESHCLQHLGKHKCPREFEIVQELPKNYRGKMERRDLGERAISDQGNLQQDTMKGSGKAPTTSPDGKARENS
jgi:long-chain acyl-CoA synthetase